MQKTKKILYSSDSLFNNNTDGGVIMAAAKEVTAKEIVAPVADATQEVIDDSQNWLFSVMNGYLPDTLFGVNLGHFFIALTLITLVYFLTRYVQGVMHSRLSAYAQRTKNTIDNRIVAWLTAHSKSIAFVSVLGLSYTLALVGRDFVDVMFRIDIALILVCLWQFILLALEWFIHGSDVSRRSVRLAIIADSVAIFIRFFAVFSILLVLNVRIDNLEKMSLFNWIIPFFSVGILVPYMKNGGLSALKFARVHDRLRLRNTIRVGDITGTLTRVTLSKIEVYDATGQLYSVPMSVALAENLVVLSTRHSMEIHETFHFSHDTDSDALSCFVQEVREIVEEYTSCKLRDVRIRTDNPAYRTVSLLYNITLKKTGTVSDKEKHIRDEIILEILKGIDEDGDLVIAKPCCK